MSGTAARKSSPRKGSHAKPVTQVHMHVTRERVGEELSIDEYIALTEMAGKKDIDPAGLRMIVGLMAKFVVDARGAYLPYEEARALLGKSPLRQLGIYVQTFIQAVESAAVPEASGGDSEPD